MNEDQMYSVCDVFGLRTASPHGGSRGLNISIACPLAPLNHNDPVDYNLSCSVSLSDEDPSLCRCFSFNCGYKGSFYKMLELATTHLGSPANMVAVLEEIAPTEKFTLDSSLARSKKKHEAVIERMRTIKLPEKEQDLLSEARLDRFKGSVPKYVLGRGLTIETCKEWELGFDKSLGRLIFPIRRYDGELVGLSGRILPSAARKAEAENRVVSKYHNYAGLDKTRYLFGEHRLKKGLPIIICEGQIDAILTWQYLGIPALGILGEGFSQHHVRTISAYEPPIVYLFPDDDPPGRLGAEKIHYALKGRVPLRLMRPPEGKDPGACTLEETDLAFKNATVIGHRIDWGTQ